MRYKLEIFTFCLFFLLISSPPEIDDLTGTGHCSPSAPRHRDLNATGHEEREQPHASLQASAAPGFMVGHTVNPDHFVQKRTSLQLWIFIWRSRNLQTRKFTGRLFVTVEYFVCILFSFIPYVAVSTRKKMRHGSCFSISLVMKVVEKIPWNTNGWRSPAYESWVRTKYSGFTAVDPWLMFLAVELENLGAHSTLFSTLDTCRPEWDTFIADALLRPT